MVISGVWHQCDDGLVRPVVRAEVLASNGSWVKAPFLLDTGADRTVFSADILTALRLPSLPTQDRLGGIGGEIASVNIETQIRLTRENNAKVILRGHYAGVTKISALEMSVLGRDVINLFAVIVDWPQPVICLLGQRHGYAILQQ